MLNNKKCDGLIKVNMIKCFSVFILNNTFFLRTLFENLEDINDYGKYIEYIFLFNIVKFENNTIESDDEVTIILHY